MNCLICNKFVQNYISLSTHLRIHNITLKDYYDKYLKKPEEGICICCGEPTKLYRLSKGYQKCCSKCFQHSPLKKLHTQETNLKIWGCTCTLHNPKIIKKVKETKYKLHGDENYNNHEKARETLLNTTGYDNVAKIPEIRKNISKALKNRNLEEKEQTNIKRRNTCIEKWGETHWTKNSEWVEKTQNNYFLKTGFKNPQQNPSVLQNRTSKYEYNGIKFDSSWELAYYIWLKDHNIEFKYHSNLYFEYTVNNVKKRYFPDFILNNCIVEIKSDYLMNESCKYHIPNEKIECMKEHNVIILKQTEIYPFIDYVKRKYGYGFFKEHRYN